MKKLHSHNSTFKRAFVKGCTDKLRETELRLDHGCSRKWLAELDLAEDLSGVAKLLLYALKVFADVHDNILCDRGSDPR